MCMHCALASLRFHQSNDEPGTLDSGGPGSKLTRRSFGAGALAAGLTVGQRAFAAESSTVKIGTFGPFTGPAAGLGLQAKKGIEFAVAQFNAAGGVNGKRVELVSYDDRANRAEAVSVVRKLIENDGVQAIVV